MDRYTTCAQCGSRLLVPVYQCITCKQLDLMKRIADNKPGAEPRPYVRYSDSESNNFLLFVQIALIIAGVGFLSWLLWIVWSPVFKIVFG